jgi:hypothetical protein
MFSGVSDYNDKGLTGILRKAFEEGVLMNFLKLVPSLMLIGIVILSKEVSAQGRPEYTDLMKSTQQEVKNPASLNDIVPGIGSESIYSCDVSPYYTDTSFAVISQYVDEANKCWKLKKIKNDSISQKELLEADLDVCKCLKNWNFPNPHAEMAKINQAMQTEVQYNKHVRDNEKILQVIKNNGQSLKNRLENLRDGMLYQANFIFDNNAKVTKYYNAGFIKDAFDDSKKLNSLAEIPVNSATRPDTAVEKATKDVLSKITISSPDTRLLSEENMRENQCLGAREFLFFNQFPDGPAFYKELAESKDFDDKKWNYSELEAQLRDTLKRVPLDAHKDAILLIKQKMIFLDKNPLIKNLFGAKNDLSELKTYFEYAKPDEKKKSEILKAYQNADKYKREVFQVLKNLAPKNQACVRTGSSCRNELLADGDRMKKFKEGLDKVYRQPAVSLITNSETERKLVDEADKFKSEPWNFGTNKLPLDQDKLESLFTDYLGKDLILPSHCRYSGPEDRVDSNRCVSSMALYCPMVEKALADNSREDGLDDLSFMNQNHFNPNFETNKEFQTLNAYFCESRRSSKNPFHGMKSFNEYRRDYCLNSREKICLSSSYENIRKLREKYDGEYQESNVEIIRSMNIALRKNPIESLSQAEVAMITGARPSPYDGAVQLQRFLDSSGEKTLISQTGRVTDFETQTSSSETFSSFQSQSYQDQPNLTPMNNYATAANFNHPEQPSIEELPREEKENLLRDWKEELRELKKDTGAQTASSQESALKARIEALETLLSQQKKLNEDQYRLLNDALSKRESEKAQTAVASSSEQGRRPKSETQSSATHEVSPEAIRAPASIKEAPISSSAAPAVMSPAVSSAKPKSSSNDSAVEREEAKLVNMKKLSDGSILIEAAGAGPQGANAITVSVSDEQYRLLQSNPNQLNLGQIEKSIPKQQLAQLEKTGVITLVLKNGANPPFEVLVEKKDNKLVYKVKDSKGKPMVPVKRIYTREALANELRAQQ